MGSVIDKAVSWAVSIANDDSHKYSQSVRWGPSYDCSSFVISAFEQAGVGAKKKGANTTQNMKSAFLQCGFKDVTSSITLSSGKGLKKGDVLLNIQRHTALVRDNNGGIVHASSPANGICIRAYYNHPWDCVLRYTADGDSSSEKVTYFTDTNEVKKIHPTIFELEKMMPQGELSVYVGMRNITKSVGPISWSNSDAELATSISFSTAVSDAQFTSLYTPRQGEIVRLYLKDEVFRGIIISEPSSDRHSASYTAVDIGWYLNKNKDTYQFTDITADAAIRKILGDLGIPIAYFSESERLQTRISGVYTDKAISEIIKDILEKIGGKWNFDFVPSGFRLYSAGELRAAPLMQLSENTAPFDALLRRGPESTSRSNENLRNAVKIVSDERVLLRASNEESYATFGMLQDVIKIDPEKENAAEVAEAKLNELCRTESTRSFPLNVCLDNYTRAGEVVSIDGSLWYITEASHEIKAGRHTLNLSVEEFVA